MHARLLVSVMTIAPCLALADPQCVLPPSVSQPATAAAPGSVTASVARAPQPIVQADEPGPGEIPLSAKGTGLAVLDHVIAAGAHVTDVGVSHGLRTVIAHNKDQFVRLYPSTDGQAVVAGLIC